MDKGKGKLTCLEWGQIHFTCNRSREGSDYETSNPSRTPVTDREREKEEEATYRRRRRGVTRRRREGGDRKEDILGGEWQERGQ
jgi:hypothetical protein